MGQAQWVCEYIPRKEDIIYVRNEEAWLLLRLNACYSVISPQLSHLQNGTSELDTAQCSSKDYSSRALRAVLVVSLNKSPFCIITVSCHNFLKVKSRKGFPGSARWDFADTTQLNMIPAEEQQVTNQIPKHTAVKSGTSLGG